MEKREKIDTDRFVRGQQRLENWACNLENNTSSLIQLHTRYILGVPEDNFKLPLTKQLSRNNHLYLQTVRLKVTLSITILVIVVIVITV